MIALLHNLQYDYLQDFIVIGCEQANIYHYVFISTECKLMQWHS